MSGRHWTPYELEGVLHHYCRPSPFPGWDASIYRPVLDKLIRLELLTTRANPIGSDPSGITVTDRGRVFVEMLLQVPEPRQVWLDPRDGKEVLPENGPTEIFTGRPSKETVW